MQPEDYPLITIGITSYNSLATIDRALASALAQDWPNCEILIVDDGSGEDTVTHLRTLDNHHPDIRVIMRPQNGGCAAARNTLLDYAKGEYVCFFDDDDESFPERVRLQYERLKSFRQKTPSDQPVYCFVARIVRKNEDPATDVLVLSAGFSSPEPQGQNFIDYLFLNTGDARLSWGQTGIGTSMAHRSDFFKIGRFDESFRRGEEWDFFIRAAKQAAWFISLPQPLMVQHVTYSEDKSGRTGLEFSLRLRARYKNDLEKDGLYLASICVAHGRFHYAQGNKVRSLSWLFAACILSPRKILRHHIRRKFSI